MKSPYLPLLDHVTLPAHAGLPYSDLACARAGDIYGELYSLFAPRLALSFGAQGLPDVALHLYVFSNGGCALVSKTAGESLEVANTFGAGEATATAARQAAAVAIEGVRAKGYQLRPGETPSLTPVEELELWARAAGPLGLNVKQSLERADDDADLVLAQLGDILLTCYSDDELQQVLPLACAFAAAGAEGVTSEEFPSDVAELIAWAHLLVRAGRGTREGAVIALNDLVAAGANNERLGAAKALLGRIDPADLEDLQAALNNELAVFGSPELGRFPVRYKLACAVADALAPMASTLYAWLQSEEGFTSWLRPNYALLGDYRKGLDAR